ncbi:MAG: DNA-deoxyinosine glycosylase [Oscillospiraceae bacterium]|jgi:hypoxanthine-DNA glycosylase|nr:DNA-deoxyinosine glycosylase [Oscillospiraceae bacterium]
MSFPPVADADSRVLVLGSMPGVASLVAGQYYAHPRNAFWPLVYGLWDDAPAADYASRLAFLQAHRIALWDAARTCLREGSGDAAIREALPNDLPALFARHPGIHTICCNGQTAAALLLRLLPGACEGRAVLRLPSTSPAYTLPFETKLAAWRALREAAEREA